MATLTIILLSLYFNARSCTADIDIQELKYALFTAGPSGGFDSSGVVPAIELAEELINADSSILPGYNLTHTPVADTMCDRSRTLADYFNTLLPPDNPTVLGLLGCGCSVASTATAEIIHFKSLSQVSYASASLELSERRLYQNFFRTLPSNADITRTLGAFAQFHNWTRVAFVTQNETLFTEAFEDIQVLLNGINISVVNRVIPSNVSHTGLIITGADFSPEDYRIFLINAQSSIGRRIICEAYQEGYTYPRYVWLTYGWYQDRWWTEEVNPEPISCTDDQLAEFLHRTFSLQLFPVVDKFSGNTIDTGLTTKEFDSLYRMRLDAGNYSQIFLAPVAYDALWTLALALDKTREMAQTNMTKAEIMRQTTCDVNLRGDLVPLENFSYSNQFMGCVIRWNLERTNFTGASGHVFFDGVGSRVLNYIEFFQYRYNNSASNLSNVLVGSVHRCNSSGAQFTYTNEETTGSVFPSGVPQDGTPVFRIITFHLALVILYDIFAAAGLVFTTICLIFNFTQRNKKVVKITSPNINYLIIVGAYMTYFSIFFRVLPSTDFTVNTVRCFMDYVLSIMGYSVAYSAVLVKMGRVYHIFHNPSLTKKTLKDWKMLSIALAISMVGAILLLIQVAVPPLRPIPTAENATNSLTPETRTEFGIRIQPQVYVCFKVGRETLATIWIGLILFYVVFFQIVGLILAFQTRKVKIKLLNDSKYIAAMIYVSTVSVLVNAIALFIDSTLLNIVEVLFSGSLLAASTIFLAMAFLPAMITLCKDPTGQFVMGNQNGAQSESRSTGIRMTGVTDVENSVERTSKAQLEQRITELETRLKLYEVNEKQQSLEGSQLKSISVQKTMI